MSSKRSEESDTDDSKDNSKQIIKMVARTSVASTPVSLLIESLVKNLCTIFENNDDRAKKIYNIICSQLFKLNLIDESYQMPEFEGIRSQYQKALYQLVTAARNGDESVTGPPIWTSEDLIGSHYYREFDEIEYIAGGGFGQVFRVRHKLDGSEYAVKKIYIRSNSITSVRNYLKEVKTFASLNHSNIVQYKVAWLELGVPTARNAILPSDTNVTDSYNYYNNSDDKNLEIDHSNSFSEIFNNSLNNNNANKSSSEFTVEFEAQKSKHYSYSSNSSAKKKRNRSRNSISEGGKAICKFNFEEALQVDVQKQQWATLYIQMSLCQITLKQWLEKRNETEIVPNPNHIGEAALVRFQYTVRRETVLEVLQQVLRGLQYIHSKGIVHHDIKPSNIFMQMDGGNIVVQLGDFGLACPLQNSQHSLAFGTKLYAAPEQLSGKCDPKVCTFLTYNY